jgi:hypothetical protein
LKITIELNDGWWDWDVEDDPNARGTYCGTTSRSVRSACEDMLQAIQDKARHPYNPKVRTEY